MIDRIQDRLEDINRVAVRGSLLFPELLIWMRIMLPQDQLANDGPGEPSAWYQAGEYDVLTTKARRSRSAFVVLCWLCRDSRRSSPFASTIMGRVFYPLLWSVEARGLPSWSVFDEKMAIGAVWQPYASWETATGFVAPEWQSIESLSSASRRPETTRFYKSRGGAVSTS